MENNATTLTPEGLLTADEVLKVTALLYFKEALVTQDYESCKELIDLALKFGATKEQISDVIAALLRGDKPGGQTKAIQTKNRLRPLKEK
jgi:hypothetical protein